MVTKRVGWKHNYARDASQSKYPGMWRDLIAAWVPHFGPTGSMLFDVSGWHNHGNLTGMDNGTDWVIGRNGYVLDFDGSDDRVLINAANSLINKSKGTVIASFRMEAKAANNTVYNFRTNAANNYIIMRLSGTVVARFKANNITKQVDLTGITEGDGKLHRVSSTWDVGQDEFKAYVDGAQVGSTETGLGVWSGAITEATIGDVSNANRFLGQIESVFHYNRALTAQEIAFANANPYALFELKEPVWKSAVILEDITLDKWFSEARQPVVSRIDGNLFFYNKVDPVFPIVIVTPPPDAIFSTFTIAKPTATFTLKKPIATFSVKKPSATFELN